jgi:hypothetical protein
MVTKILRIYGGIFEGDKYYTWTIYAVGWEPDSVGGGMEIGLSIP